MDKTLFVRPRNDHLARTEGIGNDRNDELMWLYSTGHTETRNSHSQRGVFDEPTPDEKVPGRI